MRKLFWLGASLCLTACLEPQIAPDLSERQSSDFNVEFISKDLNGPWSVAELPNGNWLVTEKGGKLLRLSNTGKTVIAGLPKDIFVAGQGGLLDVVLAPDFETTQQIYLSYAYGDEDTNGTAILSAKLDGTQLIEPLVIFRASPPKSATSHYGGRLAFLADGTLILTLGDGFAFREDAQKADTHLGKLIRITGDGGTPDDNPFLGQDKDGRAFKPQIYSLGHRNVQGLAIDPVTGEIWAHEHGPRGGDELNLIKPGQNYGWPLATTGTDYNGARISPFESFEGTAPPIYDWVPSIAPSGLAIYRGDLFSDWQGDALIGGLASRDLRRVDIEDGKAVDEEDLLSDLKGRIRDVRVDRAGAILILMEDADLDGDGEIDPKSGLLLRLTPK